MFHRAFDVTPDPFEAMETLINCGVKRILTSGQASSAPEGMELIKELSEKAGNRIEILPGAGITQKNVTHFVSYTGARQIHFSSMEEKPEPSVSNNRSIYFDGALFPREDIIKVTSTQKILEVVCCAPHG